MVAGALWLAFKMPSMRCVYSGDVGSCQDQSATKVAIGVLGILVGVLVFYLVAKMEG